MADEKKLDDAIEIIVGQSQLIKVIKSYVACSSQKKVARHLNITPQYLNDILHGRRDISEQVADRLGYRRLVVFEKRFPADNQENL
jgi:transcriptional regulator with XRE-family HTH domain